MKKAIYLWAVSLIALSSSLANAQGWSSMNMFPGSYQGGSQYFLNPMCSYGNEGGAAYKVKEDREVKQARKKLESAERELDKLQEKIYKAEDEIRKKMDSLDKVLDVYANDSEDFIRKYNECLEPPSEYEVVLKLIARDRILASTQMFAKNRMPASGPTRVDGTKPEKPDPESIAQGGPPQPKKVKGPQVDVQHARPAEENLARPVAPAPEPIPEKVVETPAAPAPVVPAPAPVISAPPVVAIAPAPPAPTPEPRKAIDKEGCDNLFKGDSFADVCKSVKLKPGKKSLEDCRRKAAELDRAFKEKKRLEDQIARLEQQIGGRLQERLDRAEERAERRREREENYRADGAGCRDCEQYERGGLAKTPLIMGGVLAGLGAYFQHRTNKDLASRAERLGVPYSPPPYATPFNAGYPFMAMGLYGAYMGGMGGGAWGCSPMAGNGFFNGPMGPFGYNPAASIYGGYGFPYGGGMYNPGYMGGMFPYGSPWGVNPLLSGSLFGGLNTPFGNLMLGAQGGMNPMLSAMMGGMNSMMGGMNPMMMGGMNPMMMGGMNPMMMGGMNPMMGGMNPMMMGGMNPMMMGGMNPMMANMMMNPMSMMANPMGGPMGMMGPFSMMNPWGNLSNPFMGGNAMGGMQYQMQMMQQYMYAMQDYQRKLQLASQISQQMQELYQQYFQIMYGSGGNFFGGGGPSLGASGGFNGYLGVNTSLQYPQSPQFPQAPMPTRTTP